MTEALRARARERFKAWTDWYLASGYRARSPGTNYNAGWVYAATLIAIAQGGEAGADGEQLWRLVSGTLLQKDLLPALQRGVLRGGDWSEGWQYGPLSVASYSTGAARGAAVWRGCQRRAGLAARRGPASCVRTDARRHRHLRRWRHRRRTAQHRPAQRHAGQRHRRRRDARGQGLGAGRAERAGRERQARRFHVLQRDGRCGARDAGALAARGGAARLFRRRQQHAVLAQQLEEQRDLVRRPLRCGPGRRSLAAECRQLRAGARCRRPDRRSVALRHAVEPDQQCADDGIHGAAGKLPAQPGLLGTSHGVPLGARRRRAASCWRAATTPTSTACRRTTRT